MSILENLSKTFNEKQAKSIVSALEEFEAEKQHVTREELDSALKLQTAEFNASMKKIESDLTDRVKDAEISLVKWVIGLMIAQTSITIAILKMIG